MLSACVLSLVSNVKWTNPVLNLIFSVDDLVCWKVQVLLFIHGIQNFD